MLIGGVVALVLGGVFGGLAYAFLGLIGFFSFIVAFFAGPAAGGAVAEVIRRAVKKRRTRGMKWLAAVLFLLGVFAAGILLQGFPRMFVRWDVLLFAGLGASTIYARML